MAYFLVALALRVFVNADEEGLELLSTPVEI
jgi:hypothetical protein